jgi:oligoendopeptidase F
VKKRKNSLRALTPSLEIFRTFSPFSTTSTSTWGNRGEGQKVKLTHGTYSVMLRDSDQKVSKGSVQFFIPRLQEHDKTVAATYIGNVKKTCFLRQSAQI